MDELPRPTGTNLGQVSDYFEGGQKYLQYIKQTVEEDFRFTYRFRLCAWCYVSLAPYLFADLEADISTMGTSPNGMNINDGVGSTHPEVLAELVKEKVLILVLLSMVMVTV